MLPSTLCFSCVGGTEHTGKCQGFPSPKLLCLQAVGSWLPPGTTAGRRGGHNSKLSPFHALFTQGRVSRHSWALQGLLALLHAARQHLLPLPTGERHHLALPACCSSRGSALPRARFAPIAAGLGQRTMDTT